MEDHHAMFDHPNVDGLAATVAPARGRNKLLIRVRHDGSLPPTCRQAASTWIRSAFGRSIIEWSRRQITLNVARVSFMLGPWRRYPARAQDDKSKADEATYQRHQ